MLEAEINRRVPQVSRFSRPGIARLPTRALLPSSPDCDSYRSLAQWLQLDVERHVAFRGQTDFFASLPASLPFTVSSRTHTEQ